MGQCSRKGQSAEASSPLAASTSAGSKVASLPSPVDDVVGSICALGERHFVTAGVDGYVYFYDWHKVVLDGKFRAHKKATNQVLPLGSGRILTASNDATVKLWNAAAEDDVLPAAATSSGTASAASTFTGHEISVVAMDILNGSFADSSGGTQLVTGSRDCSLRSWDLETAKELSRRKVLRNVVTPQCLRRLRNSTSALVQASEDLQFRLWDLRIGGNVPAHAVHAGPDQLVSMDLSDDGNYVICGSKGFSRETCLVKIFDLRSGLQEMKALPCADQTIEALCTVSADRCLIAGKDGFVRTVDIPEVNVTAERPQGKWAYTAMATCRRSDSQGPVVFTAASTEEGVGLELLAFPDASMSGTPTVLASSM